MREGFWKTKMDLNHERGLPVLLKHMEEHGVVDNFRLVSGRKKNVERKGPWFVDSDLFKWIEGAAWDLASHDDPKARAEMDRMVDEAIAAQRPDGYLDTFFHGEIADQRFRNLPLEHELYCAGHMFQAAIAHYRVTGSDKFLNAATRYADYLVSVFGHGKREEADGHPEVEMALIELYRTTGKKDYLDLAGYFLSFFGFAGSTEIEKMDAGGKMPLMNHAVRALYLSSGGADYFAETGDKAYGDTARRLWDDLTSTKMYVTGGVGSRYQGEAIGEPYELPNERAYTETCAAIASAMFSFRMLQLSGESRYADEMERALYNGVISGVGLDGKSYYYVNPLACFGDYQRQEWHACTCCPGNMVRTLASIPGYMYSVSDEGVWVHLYDNSKVEYALADGTPFTLDVKTDYPWDGNVDIKVGLREPTEFTLHLRVPQWCESPAVAINGQEVQADEPARAAIRITRKWKNGDSVHANFGMPVTLIEADPRVREDLCSVAVQRGPLVYCAETTDNPGVSIRDLELASDDFETARSDTLGGAVTIKGKGLAPDPSAGRGPLYRPRGSGPANLRETPVKLIPYYAWANRGAAHMAVWLPFRK
jgi:hypothetical protein